MKKYLILILFSLTFVLDAQTPPDSTSSDYLFIPIGMYARETSAVLGGAVMYTQRPPELPMYVSPNSLTLNVMASFKKQVQVLLMPYYNIWGGKYAAGAKFQYKYWPTPFYGLGNDSDADDKETCTVNHFKGELYIKKRFRKYFLFGGGWEYLTNKLTDFDSEGYLQAGTISGSEEYNLSGIDIIAQIDTRDNTFTAEEGLFYDLNIRIFEKQFGSDYSFAKYKANLTHFFKIARGHVVAWQGVALFTVNDAPYQEISRLGGQMRGFDSQRYIDNHMLTSRLEYRTFPFESGLLRRWGAVAFAEYGQVAHEVSDFRMDKTHYTYGMGLRYVFFAKERLNFRLDFGFSREDYDIIFVVREAF